MPVDYSKWDALELSDDSDIEVHPNVDKKSFIRAKQHQIHEQRAQRKREIETLKYERIINDGLLERINGLLDSLKKHEAEATAKNPDQLVFEALIESAGDPGKDEPPKPPEGVYTQQKDVMRYSKMMGSLIDQVKKEVDEENSGDKYKDYVDGVRSHLTKVQNLQQELLAKLAELEKEEKSKITSESIHDGFNVSAVAKQKAATDRAGKAGGTAKKTAEVELLNPSSNLASTSREISQGADSGVSSGAEADIEDGALLNRKRDDAEEDGDEESSMKLSQEGKEFAKIKPGDYRALLQYISQHPEVVSEQTQDGLLVEAFDSQMKGQDKYAKACVHNGLLIQYCRQLGRDGVAMFFKRVTTQGHQAQQVFSKDVEETYARIKKRAAELNKEEAERDSAGVEQIQLHAVEPGTEIHIIVPQASSEDEGEQEARKIFESFPPGLQRALESGSLEKVNEVLGKMSVEEAEEVVELLGKGGMLSLQEGVIDATNEEGQRKLKEIEENERRKKTGDVGEPGEAVPLSVDEVD